MQRAPCTTGPERGPKCWETAVARANTQGRRQPACVDMGGQKPIPDRGCIGRGQLAQLDIGERHKGGKGQCKGRGQLA